MNATTPTGALGQTRRVVRALGILFSVLALIVASLAGVWWLARQRAARERAQWKGPTLERLAGLSLTNEAIRRELADKEWGWAHEQVLDMTNGEFIIYAYQHGANNGFVDHLFLGHGSDGRWLYSTYHFCTSMAMIRADDPPGSQGFFI